MLQQHDKRGLLDRPKVVLVDALPEKFLPGLGPPAGKIE
jgi:hypothetical protein